MFYTFQIWKNGKLLGEITLTSRFPPRAVDNRSYKLIKVI